MGFSPVIEAFSESNLHALINNEIAGVKISDFATIEEIDSFVKSLVNHSCRTKSVEQVTRLGISQYQQGVCINKKAYFEQ